MKENPYSNQKIHLPFEYDVVTTLWRYYKEH